jgi:glutamate racemase
VGVFDSGVGGLSVLRELRRELPAEDFLYVADSAHAPYGDKPGEFVEQRSLAIAQFLLAQGAKALVVACNTATGAAIAALRARFAVPIVGMEPAIKPAAGHTRSGVVGVLATAGTATSEKFAGLLSRFGRDTAILVQPCPGLVELVEAGELAGPRVRAEVEKYVAPLLRGGADTIVLGCTHYPFLRAVIEEIAGNDVAVIDPNPAVARELRRRLEQENLLAQARGREAFWSSDTPARAARILSQLWGGATPVQPLPL